MARCVLPTPLGPIQRTASQRSTKPSSAEVEHGLAVEARLRLEVVVLDAADLGKLGAAEATVGGGLLSREHLGLGDARQEGEVSELERRRLPEVLVEVLRRVPEGEAAEVVDQSVSLFTCHRRHPPCRPVGSWVLGGASSLRYTVDRALMHAGPPEVLIELLRALGLASPASRASPSVGLPETMRCDGVVVEGAVAGGVAQGLGDARDADLVGELEDLAHVVAGGPAAQLHEALGEGLGDRAEPLELLARTCRLVLVVRNSASCSGAT